MNFIGVETGQSSRMSLPNGNSVSQAVSTNEDFYSVLERIETYTPDNNGQTSTAQQAEPEHKEPQNYDKNTSSTKNAKEKDGEVKASSSKGTVKDSNEKVPKDKRDVSAAEAERDEGSEQRENDVIQKHEKKLKKKHIVKSGLQSKKNINKNKAESVSRNSNDALEELSAVQTEGAEAFIHSVNSMKQSEKRTGFRNIELHKGIIERVNGHEEEQVKGSFENFSLLRNKVHTSETAGKEKKRWKSGNSKEKGDILADRIMSDRQKDSKETVKVVDLRSALQTKENIDIAESAEEPGKLLDITDELGESKPSFLSQDDAGTGMRIRHTHATAGGEANRFRQFMKEQGNADIVRDAKLILKDETTGEIKLILKPEKLGEVRIRLSLEDNRIAGRIIVENNSVRDYFEENLSELLDEFENSGFEGSQLDVFVRQEGTGENRGSHKQFLSRAVAETFEDAVPEIAYHNSDSLVNLVV